MPGQNTYEFGSGIVSWKVASSSCALATPKYRLTDGGEVTVEFGDELTGFGDREEAWLGYILDPVILQSVGCMPYDINIVPRLATFYDTGADPGICFSACREKGYIGLMGSKCFCLNTLPAVDTFKTECQQTCSSFNRFNDEAVCGGDNMISLYKQADGISASDVKEFPIPMHRGSCVMYDKNAKQFYSAKCTMAYRVGCQSLSGEPFDIMSRTVPWLQMTRFCYSQNSYPYENKGALRDKNTDYFQVWTGMIKAGKINNYRKGTNTPLEVAYVINRNGKYQVQFTPFPSTDKKGFICQEGPSTVSSEPVTTTSDNPDATSSSEPEPEPVAEGDEASLLPLYIILPLAIIVIAIVVILLVIRMRRKKRSEQKSQGLMKNPFGKPGKKRKRSLTEGSHLSRENIVMYDCMEEENKPMTGANEPIVDMRPPKRSMNRNFSNHLIATIPLENPLGDTEPLSGDTNNQETSATDADTKEQLNDNVKATPESKVADKDIEGDKFAPNANAKNHGNPNPNAEYARINKARKISPPEIDNGEEMYNKAGEGKKENIKIPDPNYDQVKFDNKDGNMYDTTSKPMTVPTDDKLYDGLSRF